ncbi:MAG: hypothetical protein ACRD0K_12655 [Egibacteraceae bacterium]
MPWSKTGVRRAVRVEQDQLVTGVPTEVTREVTSLRAFEGCDGAAEQGG